MPNQLLKKIYRKLFPTQQQAAPFINAFKGENIDIHPTSSLVTVNKGKIILKGNNYIGKQVELGTTGTIEIGNNTSIQDRCILLEDIEIGKNCVLAPNVYISSGRHYFDHAPNFYIKDQDAMVANDSTLSKTHSKKVTIGDDCWLGINSVIMSGVNIGRGCVIGANSVVTKDLEPFSVVGGIPAKLLKKRLEFVPKNNIQFNNENDLPNFYKGFLVDVKNLEKGKAIGGIITEDNFTCYMGTDGAKISLELMPLELGSASLFYNNQELVINSKETSVIEFNIGKNEYHNFTLKGHSTLLIKSVSIKNN